MGEPIELAGIIPHLTFTGKLLPKKKSFSLSRRKWKKALLLAENAKAKKQRIISVKFGAPMRDLPCSLLACRVVKNGERINKNGNLFIA